MLVPDMMPRTVVFFMRVEFGLLLAGRHDSVEALTG
jgi:hypothetical protein